MYTTVIGAETPCVSRLSKAYLPASTISGATLITDSVFSRRYILADQGRDSLSGGAIAGIVIGAVLAAAGTPAFLILIIRRIHRGNNKNTGEKAGNGSTFPPNEPALDPASQIAEVSGATASRSPQELASPQSSTPITTKGMPSPANMQRTPSGPPAYEAPATIPIEMPGSTYIYEHHPAYGTVDGASSTSPRSPPQTPSAMSTRSPVLSPSSPFRADSPSNTGAFTVTPLGSPRFNHQ